MQQRRPSSSRSLVRSYLWREARSVAVATIGAIVLGLVGALLLNLLSPAFAIINAPRGKVLAFDALFKQNLGAVARALVGTDNLTAGELLHRLPVWIMVLSAVKAVSGITQWYLWERTGERVSMRLRADLVERFLNVDPAGRKDAGARAREADLSSAVTNDVRMLREYLVHFYGGLPREALQCLFTVACLFALSQKLTLLFLLGLLPAGAALSRIGKKLRKRAGRALADYSGLVEWLQQRLLGIETIKHYATEELEARNMAALGANLYDRFLRAARVKARTSPLLEAFGITALAAVLVIAIGDVAAGRTTGAVQLSFFAQLGMLSQAAARLGRYLNSNREGAAAVDRLSSMLGFLEGSAKSTLGSGAVASGGLASSAAAAPDSAAAAAGSPPAAASAPAARAVLAMDGLCVRYPGADADALSDFSFRFEGGRIYCLVGPSGAGKTTVFGVALGLVEPRAGTVRLALVAPSKHNIVYMPQKVQLAPASVAANVAYPDAAPDATRVAAALARVGLSGLVDTLPLGLATAVGEGGHGVSGGQAQRILLARLCYHDAPFAFVDEGTSALDPEVERLVYAVLRDLAARGAAVVTIAHRPSAAAIADEILLLDRGILVAAGAARAITQSPLYQRLLH